MEMSNIADRWSAKYLRATSAHLTTASYGQRGHVRSWLAQSYYAACIEIEYRTGKKIHLGTTRRSWRPQGYWLEPWARRHSRREPGRSGVHHQRQGRCCRTDRRVCSAFL